MAAQLDTFDFDAVVCASDLLAIGAMSALREAGVSVPDDVAVAGWDNVVDGQYHVPTLTTVAPDLAALADMAMEALVARIEGDRSPGTTIASPMNSSCGSQLPQRSSPSRPRPSARR